MKQWTYNKEIQTLLEQFTSAFNDIIIKRENSLNNTSPSPFKASFVYAPKQRIFDVLKNPAPGGISLPAVCININSLQRDATRSFNKSWGFNIETGFPGVSSTDFVRRIKNPVPINIGVNMSILTKFQSDMDQIISNFVPYCDPYIIISWKLPVAKGKDYEIRTEILWSGNITLNYPTDLTGNQSYRVAADTSFTIKGWLFKSDDLNENYKKIYVINSDFVATNEEDIYSCKLITDLENYQTDFVSISARPQLRWATPPTKKSSIFEILGHHFGETRAIYVSASDPSIVSEEARWHNPFNTYNSLSAKYPPFYGYKIPEFTIYSSNYISFLLPFEINGSTKLDIIIENEAGYGSLINDTSTIVRNISSYSYISPICDGIDIY